MSPFTATDRLDPHDCPIEPALMSRLIALRGDDLVDALRDMHPADVARLAAFASRRPRLLSHICRAALEAVPPHIFPRFISIVAFERVQIAAGRQVTAYGTDRRQRPEDRRGARVVPTAPKRPKVLYSR